LFFATRRIWADIPRVIQPIRLQNSSYTVDDYIIIYVIYHYLRLRLHYILAARKAPIEYRMYNFQKLGETTNIRCNNSSENIWKGTDRCCYWKLFGTSGNVA
jgi:hypothetical protein